MPIVLTDDEREQLLAWSRRPSSAQALALRSRVVLACAAAGAAPNGGRITGIRGRHCRAATAIDPKPVRLRSTSKRSASPSSLVKALTLKLHPTRLVSGDRHPSKPRAGVGPPHCGG
jgi:hypothetical protein